MTDVILGVEELATGSPGPNNQGTGQGLPRVRTLPGCATVRGSFIERKETLVADQLVRRPGPVRDHVFDITFRESGVEAHVFTFG